MGFLGVNFLIFLDFVGSPRNSFGFWFSPQYPFPWPGILLLTRLFFTVTLTKIQLKSFIAVGNSIFRCLSNENSDGNEKGKKSLETSKTSTMHDHFCTCFCHCCTTTRENFLITFYRYRGREHEIFITIFFFFLWT